MRVGSLKINSNVYPLKNTNSHYLLLDITIIPLHNGKIPRIFFVRVIISKKSAMVKYSLSEFSKLLKSSKYIPMSPLNLHQSSSSDLCCQTGHK